MGREVKIGSLFTGYGGLDMAAAEYFGGHTVWTSDIDPGACKIIAHRYPDVPNIGDITKVVWSDVEPIDILTGGFPCQDLSTAGKRAGMRPGTRSGLWSHMAYAISQLRPRYVVVENVRGILSAAAHSELESCPWCMGGAGDGKPDLRALGAVLGDLAELGYDARWVGLRAADVGAPHGRFRVFVFASDTRCIRGHQGWFATPREAQSGRPLSVSARRCGVHAAADADEPGSQGGEPKGRRNVPHRSSFCAGPEFHTDWCADPDLGRPDSVSDAERLGIDAGAPCGCSAWGHYAQAIHRWEVVLGRVAPAPTERSARGNHRLSARADEFMMGLPEGWVTDVPGLSRNAQLTALGNGVVPQQALAALRDMPANQDLIPANHRKPGECQ